MSQQGQVFELKTTASDGNKLWAYRYRTGGRGSRRVQRGGFASEQAAADALARMPAAMREVGFTDTRVEQLIGPDSMVVGIK
jgi:hypothetical protein